MGAQALIGSSLIPSQSDISTFFTTAEPSTNRKVAPFIIAQNTQHVSRVTTNNKAAAVFKCR